jgi:hypothetical protein
MWLMTPIGFYSVVAHRDKPQRVLVRARCRQDLERLLELDTAGLPPSRAAFPAPIVQTLQADYPYRVELGRKRWEHLAGLLARHVDYPNFKDAVKDRQGPARAGVYTSVWGALHRIEHEDQDPRVARPTSAAQLTMSAAGYRALELLDDPVCVNCGEPVEDERWDLCEDCDRTIGGGVPA